MSRPADPHAHAALIAAARREFLRHGIQKARIEDITAACGLSKGAFYLHFDSKEALFRGLVAELAEGMNHLLETRMREEQAYFTKFGSVKKREWQEGSKRLQEFDELSRRSDRAVLELIWSHRDITEVLLSGVQGTEFEGVMWSMVDREVKRVVESCERMKKWGMCRGDVPSEVIGSMLIGSWLLIMRRMTKLTEKPDLDAWIDALKELITHGTVPHATPPVQSVKPVPSAQVSGAPSRRSPTPRNRLRRVP